MKEISGNLLDVTEGFIIQQCNCNTVKSDGLAAAIESRFPYCNAYKSRRRNGAVQPDVPGTYKTFDAGRPTIVCLMAQWAPGKPGAFDKYYPNPPAQDTRTQRLKWFVESMTLFLTEVEWKGSQIALPRIGCGLAGGKWSDYKNALEKLEKRFDTEFVVYRRDED